MALRRRFVMASCLAVAGLTAGVAVAAWLTTGAGAGAATGGNLPQGATPTAVAAGGDVTVSWPQSTVHGSFLGALSGGGYVITRSAQGSSTPVTPGSACSGTIAGSTATLSCVEHSVPAGAWQYTVQPALGNWRGAESAKSAVVAAPALTVTFPANGGSYTNPTWNGGCATPGVCGTATDQGGSGLASVQVSIRQGSGNYWNGVSFSSASEVLFTATGTTNWSLPFGASNFPASGSYTVRAVATDNAGDTNTSPATFSFNADSTPPTATITFPSNGASYRASTYNAGCTPTGICGTAADVTGVQAVAVSIRRVADGAYWNGSAFSGSTETFNTVSLGSPGATSTTWNYGFAMPADGSYVVHVQTSDTAGNAQTGTTYAATASFTVDATAPTQSISTTSATGAYVSGTTLYWNGNNTTTGSFKLVDAVTDGGSGPASATYPAIGTTGWAHAGETATSGSGSAPTISYTSSAYTWGSGAATPADQVVTGADAVGNQVTTAVHFVDDTAAPTGGALTVNGTAATGGGSSSTSSSGSFAISRTDYSSDAGSGLASSQLTRRTGALSSSDGIATGTCSGYGSPAVITGSPAQTLSGPACYLYTLTGTDNVGNQASVSTTVGVDTTAPSAPSITLSSATGNTYVTGTTAYINPQAGKSGGFQAAATTTDADSGIQRVDYPTLAGFSAGGGSDSTSPYSSAYSWSGVVGASGAQTVSAVDNVGLSNSTTFTVTPDTTAPTGTVTSPTAGTVSGTVSMQSSNAGDTGSGVASVAYSYCSPAPCTPSTSIGSSSTGPNYTVAWNTSAVADGSYDVRAVITDNVGNTTTTPVVAVSVANVYAFQVFSPGTQTAGTAFPSSAQTIQLLVGGNPTSTLMGTPYTGSKTITFSGPGNGADGSAPTYPATISFTNGVGTVPATSITLVKAQSGVALTATDLANSITGSSATFNVNAGTAAGLIWTNASTKSGASTVSCSGTVGTSGFTCTISPANGTGNGRFFKGNVSLIDAHQNIVTNSSGSAISVVITGPGATVTGSPVSIANGASQSGTQFNVAMPNGSGTTLVTATATVGGSSTSVKSTVG